MAASQGGRPSREGPLGRAHTSCWPLLSPQKGPTTQLRSHASSGFPLGLLPQEAKSRGFMYRKFQPPPGLPWGGVQLVPVLSSANQETVAIYSSLPANSLALLLSQT